MPTSGYLLPKDEFEIVCLKVVRQPSVNSKIDERPCPANNGHRRATALLQGIG